jgi:restriction system protein
MKDWFSQQFDDYVEETAVGTRWWLVVLPFALGLPLVIAILERAYPPLYRPGSVAIALLIGVIVGLALLLVARERRRYRVAAIDHTGDIGALRRKSWGEFEILVGEAIRRQGYVVKERGGFRSDLGIDLIAEHDRTRVIVQCKHWRTMRVHEGPVKELYADVKSQGFAEGWLVTSGRFTSRAKSWARGKELRLIDGEALVELIAETPASMSTSPRRPLQMTAAQHMPECPNCGTLMRRLVNHYNQSMFWGCSDPVCDWTIDDPAEREDQPPLCSRGHTMTQRKTSLGSAYWACSDPNCSRKRLRGLNQANDSTGSSRRPTQRFP